MRRFSWLLVLMVAACGGSTLGDGPFDGGAGGGSGSGGGGGGGGRKECTAIEGCDSREMCRVDCNTCTCTDGQWACTLIACADAQPPVCDADANPNKKYLSTSPTGCGDIVSPCPASTFTDECGCGCICPYDDPDRQYVARSQSVCAVIDYVCPFGTEGFSDACGCGCRKQPCQPPAGTACCSGDFIVDGHCADGGYVCPAGFQLMPQEWCKGPLPPCKLPDGYQCCDGDAIAFPICDPDGRAVCPPGYPLTPRERCTLPPPPLNDAGPG
jgi:hypothetical protein